MIDGPNEYCYVRQNPWTMFDPEGLGGTNGGGRNHGKTGTDPAVGFVSGAVGEVGNLAVAMLMATTPGQMYETGQVAVQELNHPGSYEQTLKNRFSAMVNLPSTIAKDVSEKIQTPEGLGALTVDLVAAVDGVVGIAKVARVAKVAMEAPTESVALTEVKAAGNCGTPQVCFVAGTLVAIPKSDNCHSGESPIEQLHVGDRVLSADSCDQQSKTSVDLKTWKVITLEMHIPGDIVHIQLLRSPDWLGRNSSVVGSTVWLEWPEIEIKGWATILKVASLDHLANGNGRVITATINHVGTTIYKLSLSHGEPIEATGVHLIYSVTRQKWVHTRDLKIGEQLHSRDNQFNLTVTDLQKESDHKQVYNLEVESDHHFYVGNEQLLVHNTDYGQPEPDQISTWEGEGGALTPEPTSPGMADDELIQKIAERADARGGPGLGPTLGTLKHGYASRMLTIYQKLFGDRDLRTEVRYAGGSLWKSGTGTSLAGSAILDVVKNPLSPTKAWDYKFGNARLRNKQINKIRTQTGVPNLPVDEVKP